MLLDRFLVGGQWQDRAMYAITMPEWRGGGRGGAHAASAPATAEATAAEATDTFDAFAKPASGGADGATPTVTVTVSFEGGPEEPALGVPIPSPAEEPQPGAEQHDEDAAFAEPRPSSLTSCDDKASEPQVLTAQIVIEQIEVVHILPREP